jgi:hypothetical protein
MSGLRSALSGSLIYLLIVAATASVVYACCVRPGPADDAAAARPDPRAAKYPGAIMGPSARDAVRAVGGNPDDVE